MSLIKLSTRYAKSLLNLAIEQDQVNEIYSDMSLLDEMCKSSKELVLFLKNPIIQSDKKIIILEKIFKDKISKITFEFLKIVTNKKRELYLPLIATQFLNQYNKYKGILPATLITATPVDEKLKSDIKSIIRKNGTKSIALNALVEEELIGGFVLSFGDYIYDASITRQFKLLKQEFSNNEFIKKY